MKKSHKARKFVPDDSWTSDGSVPAGWFQKSAKLGLKRTFQLLLSPDGKKFSGKRSVLEYMIKNGYPEVKISEMKSLMKQDGWAPHQDLPENWLYKRNGNTLCFSSELGKFLKTREKALQFLKSRREDAKFDMLRSFSERKFVPDESWKSDDSIPEGWLQRTEKLGLKRTFQMLLSPNGKKFKGKRSVLEYMIKNGYPEEKISEIRNLMKQDGWVPHQGLPENWLYKLNGHTLCFSSDVGKFFKTREKAFQFLKSRKEDAKFELLRSFSVSGKKEKKLIPDDSWSCKSLALDESSSKDGEISFDETDSFTDASNDESESFVRSEEESNNESDCILIDQEDDNDDIVLD